MNKMGIAILIFLVCAAGAFAEADYSAMLEKIDALANFDNQDFSCNAVIVTDKPGKDREVVKVKFFRRDKDDKFLVVTLEPDVNKGEGILKYDDNIWFYDPNTRDFSHTSLKDRFGDSGANNEDFSSRSLSQDYRVSVGKEDMLGKIPVYVLDPVASGEMTQTAYMDGMRKNLETLKKAIETTKSNK